MAFEPSVCDLYNFKYVINNVARREARERQPGGGVRDAFRRRAPRDAHRPRMPLPMAWMDRDLREEPPGQVDVEEGMFARQLGDGGVLWKAQE